MAPAWYLDPQNLAELYSWLRDRGDEPDPVRFMEKPYRWNNEWREFREQHDEAARALPQAGAGR